MFTKPLRVGFVGAGLIATFHSKMLRAAGDRIERGGVFDIDRQRADAFSAASGHRVMESADEVMDSCDALYVCTWTSEHPALVHAAAQRGLAIFCEKPLATSLAAAESMADAVARAGITNQVGLILRRSPAYLFARSLITDAVAGRVMTVVFRDDQFIPVQGHYGSTWRGDPGRAGRGTLLEHSIHDVDMLRFLVGPVEAVAARESFVHGLDRIEDVCSAVIQFAGGATGTLTSVWHDNLARPSLRRVEVFCERRHVVIDGDDWWGPVTWTDHDGVTGSMSGAQLANAVSGTAGAAIDAESAAASTSAAETSEPNGTNPDVAFVEAALAGRPASPDFAVALAAHRVVEAIYQSAADSRGFVAVSAASTVA